MRIARGTPVLLVMPLLAVACSGGGASPSQPDPTRTPVATATAAATATVDAASPSASAAASESQPAGTDGVVVTFRTAGDEEYRILLTDPEDVAIAQALLAGEEETRRIPNGVIVRGGDGGVNHGYSWHIDTESVDFAEFTVELCDGRPSYVEDGSHSGERFCPWSAEVVAVEPAG